LFIDKRPQSILITPFLNRCFEGSHNLIECRNRENQLKIRVTSTVRRKIQEKTDLLDSRCCLWVHLKQSECHFVRCTLFCWRMASPPRRHAQRSASIRPRNSVYEVRLHLKQPPYKCFLALQDCMVQSSQARRISSIQILGIRCQQLVHHILAIAFDGIDQSSATFFVTNIDQGGS